MKFGASERSIEGHWA